MLEADGFKQRHYLCCLLSVTSRSYTEAEVRRRQAKVVEKIFATFGDRSAAPYAQIEASAVRASEILAESAQPS
jgi:hypothetical protein